MARWPQAGWQMGLKAEGPPLSVQKEAPSQSGQQQLGCLPPGLPSPCRSPRPSVLLNHKLYPHHMGALWASETALLGGR